MLIRYVDAKMDEFVRVKIEVGTGGVVIVNHTRTLPNGNKHGLNSTKWFGTADAMEKEFFRNGKLIVKYIYDETVDYVHDARESHWKEELIIHDSKVTVEFAMKNLLNQQIMLPKKFTVTYA